MSSASAASADLLAARRRAHTRYLIGRIAGRTILYVAIIAGSVLYLFPFLWMISTSLKSLDQVYLWPPVWLPDPITVSNYAQAWAELPFATFYRNTLFVVATCIVGSILSCTIVAFGFARLRFRGRDFLFLVLLSTMMLPGQVT
ncbi:MAG TPA: carbohydrate ABC transporter permease, partial [Candidatus Hydrogenedentes bacterium]|nr:carbohydrate ABC transporter permease [Candidatus Hydrogenedentota bacterium]